MNWKESRILNSELKRRCIAFANELEKNWDSIVNNTASEVYLPSSSIESVTKLAALIGYQGDHNAER